MKEFSLPQRVYIEDTDAGGIVYYVNYLKFMERARTELMRELGYPKPAIPAQGLLLVVHSANVNYRRPAQLDDVLFTTASISRLARSYVVFEQRVIRYDQASAVSAIPVEKGRPAGFTNSKAGEGEILCEGEIKVACITEKTMKPSPFPAPMHKTLQRTLGPLK